MLCGSFIFMIIIAVNMPVVCIITESIIVQDPYHVPTRPLKLVEYVYRTINYKEDCPSYSYVCCILYPMLLYMWW